MGGTDKKGYLLQYGKGMRAIRRYKCLMEGMGRHGDAASIHPAGASKKELESRMQKCYDICRRVLDSVGQLEGAEKEVIMLRYIGGMKWKDVAGEMGYSLQHVYRIHNRALGNLVPY